MKALRLGILSSLLLTTAAPIGSASAGVFTITYTGTVNADGRDFSGLFGSANASLSGDQAEATFRYDTTAPRSPVGQLDSADALLSATFTINARTISFPTASSSLALASSTGGFHYDFASNNGSYPGLYETLDYSVSGAPNEIPGSVFTPFYFDARGTNNNNESSFTFGTFYAPYAFDGGAAGTVTLETVSATLQSGVPEPSTWIMILLGFGGIGFLAYRKAQKNDACAAMFAA